MKMSVHLPRMVKLACVFMSIFAAAIFAIGRKPSSTRAAKGGSLKAASTAAASTQQRIASIEAELITITPHGFEPREITRPSGKFLLMIDNRSGQALMSPKLGIDAPLNAVSILNLTVPREQPNWSDVVDLPPGRYLLAEPDHPSWTCRITITAQ
jgi:hypothetical protein